MLDIDMSPAKGILFIRLSGFLDEKNVNQFTHEVFYFIKSIGVKNVVFNIDDVRYMDCIGKKVLINSFNFCQKNDGIGFICVDTNETLRNTFIQSLGRKYIVKNEMLAVKIINS